MAKSQTHGNEERELLKEELIRLLYEAKECGELTPEDEADILRYAQELLRRRKSDAEA